MSDDITPASGPAPNPAPVDNRKPNLIAGLNNLKQQLSVIPSPLDQDADEWAEFRDTQWVPLLKSLHQLSQQTAELYPGVNFTTKPRYSFLANLIRGELSPRRFQTELNVVAHVFSSSCSALAQTDTDIRFSFGNVIKALDKAAAQLKADVEQSHGHRAKI